MTADPDKQAEPVAPLCDGGGGAAADARFPDDFWFGSGTSGHQIEGDNVHCQDAHEEIYDPHGVRQAVGKQPSGKACDHWNRWREDVDLIAELGHQAWRFSCEWSRIEPAQGQVDEAALARYIARSERLAERGIKQVITLCHWTHPQWFEELGGFTRDENWVHWERHVERMARHFKPFAAAWVTLNEVEAAAGARPAHARGYARGHAIAYHILKRHSAAPVGMAGCGGWVEPLRADDAADRALAAWRQWQGGDWWLHMIRTGELVLLGHDAVALPDVRGTSDWWMINYYRRGFADARHANGNGEYPSWTRRKMFAHVPPGDRKAAAMDDDEIHPETLLRVLERHRDKPILITENGIGTDFDELRRELLAGNLAAVQEAIRRGVAVRGYLHWSTMDNFEWGTFVPRFGLVHVDFENFRRTPKPSAYLYRDIIRDRSLAPATIAANTIS